MSSKLLTALGVSLFGCQVIAGISDRSHEDTIAGSAGVANGGDGARSAAGGAPYGGGGVAQGGVQTSGGTSLGGNATPSGGKATGGSESTGGSTSVEAAGQAGMSGAADGGAANQGGSANSGGSANAGGTISSGGTPATGGAAAGGTATGGAAGLGGGGAGGQAAIVRITPIGDGILATSCCRASLFQELIKSGRTRFDFIGTRRTGPACLVTTSYDLDHEAHAGYNVSDVLKSAATGGRSSSAEADDPYVGSASDLTTWFNGHPTDVALLQMGANDLLNGRANSDILLGYSAILTRLRVENSRVRVFIALILPMATSKCSGTCLTRFNDLNASILTWASSNATTSSPISAVDLSAFDTTNTTDGIKPDETGAAWIAHEWFKAVSPLIPPG